MFATQCALCATQGNSVELYAARLQDEAIDATTFSARRFYDKKNHYRLVRCRTCGLVRSDPVLPPEHLSDLYRASTFTYDAHVKNLRQTYGHYLARATTLLSRKDAFLEIGCGNGFMLTEASKQGFKEVWGVEPSEHAAAAAPHELRGRIKTAMFNRDLFPKNTFDLICLFQTFDHLADPNRLLEDCSHLLKSGGCILLFNHDVDSWSRHLLGASSPIIDIEHTYLYNRSTLRRMLLKHTVSILEEGIAWNKHAIGYLFSLLPIYPIALKRALHKALMFSGLDHLSIWAPLGNLYAIARKKNE